MARKRPHSESGKSAKAETGGSAADATKVSHAGMVSMATVRSAVDALVKDHEKHERKRARRALAQGKAGSVVGEESFVTLGITLKQAPYKNRLRPDAIRLKHSLVEKDDEVLLIVKDPQRLVKDYLTEHGNGGVTRVLGVDKVRKRYGTHEGRRELLQQFDHFLVDQRVAPMMTNLLGKSFISTKRMPLSVDVRRDVVGGIEKALSSTAYCARRGTSTSVRVARMEFGSEEIVENVVGAVEGVAKKVYGGWDGIQSLIIKTNKSPGLPIFFGKPGSVKGPGRKENKEDAAEGTTGEGTEEAEDDGTKEAEDDGTVGNDDDGTEESEDEVEETNDGSVPSQGTEEEPEIKESESEMEGESVGHELMTPRRSKRLRAKGGLRGNNA